MYFPLTKRQTIMADKCPTRSSLHLCSSPSSHMVFVYTYPYNLIISCLRVGKRITYQIPTPPPSSFPLFWFIFHKALERHDKCEILHRGGFSNHRYGNVLAVHSQGTVTVCFSRQVRHWECHFGSC